MKTALIICILFASILFSSVIARELAQSGTGDPKAPIKCDPNSPAYRSCVAQPVPKAKCHPNSAFSRCPGTGSTSPTGKNPVNPPVKPGTGSTSPTGKNPVNPPVKPGTGKGGNPNNPVVKPGTGKPTNPNDPRYKPGQPPRNKCNGSYRCNPPEEP
ncbi:uncharacterized protein LOC132181243 isoform X2 [Corylus avellana]|uniref:uncharacterized protein LOC132181243 isoform X2 n=1 Tax=Corylus avellana TaxID=13451 RepID=UPI00286C14E9|nr:uncharacterized protein LOC132181243 isoform X2 [Corylus avellana]